MIREEIRLQVAISVIQGVLEAKHGVIGEVVPSLAVAESLRIADEFVKQWFGDSLNEERVREFEMTIDDAVSVIEETGGYSTIVKRLKELKHYSVKDVTPQPKQEWSEEDEKMRDGLISLIEEIKSQPIKRLEDWDGYIHFLKSLRPQPHWKQLITKEAFQGITEILREKYGLDDLDIVEFVMETERRLQIRVPDDWYCCGRVHTVRKDG